MTLLNYFWPVFAAAVVIGAFARWSIFRADMASADRVAGKLLAAAHRKRRRRKTYIVAVAATLGFILLWHGPLGAADRLTASIERTARTTLVFYELPAVRASLERAPLTRRLRLSGPADDFQRGELVRIMNEIPGVDSVGWRDGGLTPPLLLEALVVALIGFLSGLLVAHVVEARRRANADWRW